MENNHNKFLNTVTGKIQNVHPDFMNDARWLRNHNLVKHTEPKPMQVTNLIPEPTKEIIDYSNEGGIPSDLIPAPSFPMVEPTPAKPKSNSKTK